IQNDFLAMPGSLIKGFAEQAHLVKVDALVQVMLQPLPDEGEANQANVLLGVVAEVLFFRIEVIGTDLAWRYMRGKVGAGQVDTNQVDPLSVGLGSQCD